MMSKNHLFGRIGLIAFLLTLSGPSTSSLRAQPERQIGGIGLTVFTDPGFRGNSATFREDVSNLQQVGLNDRVSSLRVARGEVWEVCEHANYQGRCQIVSGGESDLRGAGWNDIISSARRVRGGDGGRRGGGRGGGFPPARFRIELYSNPDFSGDRRQFTDEVSNLQFVEFNDRARSMRVFGSWQICADANFQNCITVNGDSRDLARMGMTRKISSLRPAGQPR
jgi:hypothetical protein